MTTYAELRDRSLRILGNPLADGIDEELIIDAMGAAFDAILPWIPKLKSTTFTGDATTTAFNLPADFYGVDAIVVQETSEILAQAVFSPHTYFGDLVSETNSWILSPSNQITFAKAPDTGVIYVMYYRASWLKPTETITVTDVLEPPSYLEYALGLYTAAYILLPDAVGVGSVSAYKTRVDSGNPEHNPIEKTIGFLMNLYNQEMNRHPRHQKGQV